MVLKRLVIAAVGMAPANDAKVLAVKRIGPRARVRRAQLTDEGIVVRQSKTGAGELVEWTDELRRITDRAKALKRLLIARPERFELPTSWFVGRRSFGRKLWSFQRKSRCLGLNILTDWLLVSP